MIYANITGTGSYLPSEIISNAALAKNLDTTDQWIVERTGIRQRHIANQNETTAFMATQAAKAALSAANLSTIDMILVATTTSDAFFPSTACLVQAALDLHPCPAFDIAAACSGFNYALTIANQFIQNNTYQNILVIGSETMSRLVDWSDRRTCPLFGDGAGAVVLSASTRPGILASQISANGQHQKLLYANNFREPSDRTIKMEGSAILRQAITTLTKSLHQLLLEQALSIEALDWLIPHQSNLHLIHTIAKNLSLPLNRVITTIEHHANTSSASIPIALDHAIGDNKIQKGQLLLLESFGGGTTWGATLLRY